MCYNASSAKVGSYLDIFNKVGPWISLPLFPSKVNRAWYQNLLGSSTEYRCVMQKLPWPENCIEIKMTP